MNSFTCPVAQVRATERDKPARNKGKALDLCPFALLNLLGI